MDRGDTLVEVLVAIVVLSLCGLALLIGFSTSISASVDYKNLASLDTVMRTVSEEAVSQIQQSTNSLYAPCATASTYNSSVTFGVTSGFNASVTQVQYWGGSGFMPVGSACPSGSTQPQLLTVTVTNTSGASDASSFVVIDTAYSLSDMSWSSSNVAL